MNGQRRLLKFEVDLPWNDIQTQDVPRWLAVGFQGPRAVVWCEATPGAGVLTQIVALPTGAAAPSERWAYVGTAHHPTLLDGGPFVVHFFQMVQPGGDA